MNQKGAIPIILMFLFPIIIIVGCSGIQIGGDKDQTTIALVKIATRNISCELAMSGDAETNRTIVNIYESIKAGQLTDDTLAQLSDITTERPTLAADIADLISLLGVQFADDGTVLGLENVSPEMFEAIERAWNQGQALCYKVEV